MSKQHLQRANLLHQLGKNLVRRAKSCCELCSENTSLFPLEIPPFPEEPSLENSLFLCEICIQRMLVILPNSNCTFSKPPKGRFDTLFLSNDLLFLQQKIWSDIAVVQVSAVLMSHKAISLGFGWAIEMIDGVYLEEENSNWLQELIAVAQL